MGQDETPVFKLISPDDTGGSNEVIIFNAEIKDGPYDDRSKSSAKSISDQRQSRDRNGPDTAGLVQLLRDDDDGPGEHEKRDVKPHVHTYFFYANPPDPFSTLAQTNASGPRPASRDCPWSSRFR